MCGISGIFGRHWKRMQLTSMVASQIHRGPDGDGIYIDPDHLAGLGHNRLKIIDLSDAGRQPMSDPTDRYHIVFNGEIYNYLELRKELESNYEFRTGTDTEVLLAAFERWGASCLDRLIGMFAFAVWDEKSKRLFAARDRFGVKPLYFHLNPDGCLLIASEIKALHAGGAPKVMDEETWANYLAYGLVENSERTFWQGIHALLPGRQLTWDDSRLTISRWYDVAEQVGQKFDRRPIAQVHDEYVALLKESIRLRFRADVAVGINLSGGLDSSTLFGLVQACQGKGSDLKAFTFYTGDARYDELPWVRQMLEQTRHPLIACELSPARVPELAESVTAFQDEPFGGLPTLAYARLFESARAEGVTVLLDGQGMDEQWAGYDYYANANHQLNLVQGTRESPVRPDSLTAEFRGLATPLKPPAPFADQLQNLQYRDIHYTKIPRALRFNDRVSMRASTELREPFLDHRLLELALRQPGERKILNGTSKWLLRQIATTLLPRGLVEAPKRPLQTPQREWLRGPLREWADSQIQRALAVYGGLWFDTRGVRSAWQAYCDGEGDNSFFVWQWISLGLTLGRETACGFELQNSAAVN